MTGAAIPLRPADKASESELWETLVLPNMLIEALPAAIIVVDRDAVCRLLNAAAEDLIQVGRKTLLGRRLSEVIPEDCPLFSLIEQSRLSRSAVSDLRLPGATKPALPSGRATRAHWLRPGAGSLSGPSNPMRRTKCRPSVPALAAPCRGAVCTGVSSARG